MGVLTSEVGYTSATIGREGHEVYMDMWWNWWGDPFLRVAFLEYSTANLAETNTAELFTMDVSVVTFLEILFSPV
jgi:hypothetical protein